MGRWVSLTQNPYRGDVCEERWCSGAGGERDAGECVAVTAPPPTAVAATRRRGLLLRHPHPPEARVREAGAQP
jgi:hypothetical protein